MRIAAAHLANLLEFASSLGFDKEKLKQQFLANGKLDLFLIENSILEDEMIAVVKELLTVSRDEYLGLHYGCFMNVKAMGLIYNISKSATEIEHVISFLKSFLEKTFPVFELNIVNKKNTVLIGLKCSVGDEEVRKQLTDATLCIMYRELKLIVNNSCKIEVQFPCKKLDEYKKLLGDDVQKGISHYIAFDRESLNSSLNSQNISTIGELLPAFLLLLEKTTNTNKFSVQVRKMILNMCSPELPDFGKVASQFCMSSRTFQRKLADEGTSFRIILDIVKKDLFKYLQKGSHLKTQDIAFILGYSEASAYLHAAKKWKP